MLIRTGFHRLGFTARASPCTPGALTSPYMLRQRYRSTVSHHPAASSAPREVPTPLVLLSASQWAGQGTAEESLSTFVKHFTARGWNVSCIDVDPEGERSIVGVQESSAVLGKLEAELCDQLRTSGNGAGPFPPLLVAQGLATLIAETYVSSNPLSGLALFDPPLTAKHASEQYPDKLPTELAPFTYEPRFPCVVAWTPEKVKELAFWDVHRIEEQREEEAGESLDRFVWTFDREEELENAGPHELRKWAEDNGMLGDDTQVQAIDESDAGLGDAGSPSSSSSSHGSLPHWYTGGSYERNPTKSKKLPLILDESHLEESFVRGSGPGGQAINKLSTCVQLKHTPTGFMVRCQDTRSRGENREYARRRMSKELELRVFGERDSVLGKEVLRHRQKKHAKSRKQRRKAEEKRNMAEEGAE